MFPHSWVALGALLLLVPIALLACDAAGGFRAGRAPANRRIFARGRSELREANRTYGVVEDFDVLVPIYGAIRYLENIEFLRPYGARVLLCTTTDETEEFNAALEKVARENGFRIFRGEVSRAASTGKRATGGTVRDRLVRDALSEVESEYVVCIDADTRCYRPLGELVGALAARELDMASVRLVPSNRTASLLTRLQAHEYRFSMHIRTVLPWLVSGACHVARADVHREVMSRHSLFFQGNDVEVGVLAVALGYRVGHIRYEVGTNVPVTVGAWFRQRVAWAAGEVRLFIANPQIAIRHPFFWAYGALLVIVLSPLRLESVTHPGLPLMLVGVAYYLLLIHFHFEHRDRYLLLLPFYSLFTSLVMVPFGVFSYARMVLRDRNFGFIRVRRGAELRENWRSASGLVGGRRRERTVA